MTEKVLGKIVSTSLGYEDHGIFTFILMFDLEHCHQAFGGYSLGGEYTDHVIQGILDATGKDKWEDLEGAICWCEYENSKWNENIISIEAPDFVKHKGKFSLKEGKT